MPSAARSTVTSPGTPSHTDVKRSKPLKYAYEKEIVLYAHHKSLDYFSTECIYSPEAFRGSARALIKNLERIRPSAILDIVRSGEDMAKLCPGYKETHAGSPAPAAIALAEEEEGGCGSSNGRTGGGEMQSVEEMLVRNEKAATQELEVEFGPNASVKPLDAHNGSHEKRVPRTKNKKPKSERETNTGAPKSYSKQTMGKCSRCGYLSSQVICKACMLLEGLNKSRPKTSIAVGDSPNTNGTTHSTLDLTNQAQQLSLGLT
jgi:cytoplasmic tRNA 2-thiolation protein 1